MFNKKRALSKVASVLLSLTLAMPGTALQAHAEEVPETTMEAYQQEETIESVAGEESTEAVIEEEASDEVREVADETAEEDTSEEVTEMTEETEEVEEADEPEEEETEMIDPQGLPEIKGDYYRQYASTLYANQELVCSDETADISVDEKTKKLVVSGTKDALMSGEFSIEKTFHLDGKSVSRFSFDASAAKGQKITLGFYLDESSEPFVTKEIVKQRKKNTWEFTRDYSADTLGMNLTGEHTLKIKVLDSSDSKPSFCLNWFEFVESSVPVIYFNIDEADGSISEMNSSGDHSAECYGSMSIRVPEGYRSVDSGKVLTGGDYTLEYIRGRGNSTWDAPKKPYKLKLSDGAKLLGMGKNKHWVLLANYYDNSLLRNRVTYWLGKQLGMPYTPNLEPVDLVMNGEYYGSYFLSEQIRLDKNRVDLKDLEKTPNETEEDKITGGYLLAMSPYSGEETKKTIRTKKGIEYLIESPEFDGYENEAQVNYISNYLQKIEDALYHQDFKSEDGVSYTDLMDLKSTALYYWIQEFSMNGDGYLSGSTYLYKPEHDKLYWGPLWDFDFVAWGSTEYNGLMTEGWCHNGSDGYGANWNERLFEDPVFANEVFQSWDQLKPLLVQVTAPGGQMDLYAADMETTARYNFEKLGFSPLGQEEDPSYTGFAENEDIFPEPGETMTNLIYEDEITRFKTWINQRMEWVDDHVASLVPEETTITFKDDKGNVLETRTGIVGRTLRALPDAPKKKGYTFDYWKCTYFMTLDMILENYGCKSEEELRSVLIDEGMSAKEAADFIKTYKKGATCTEYVDIDTKIRKDMVLTPVYINNKKIIRPTKIYLSKKQYTGIYYREGEGYLSYPGYQVIPFYAFGGDVTLSTDDESVVRFNEYNDPEVMGPGECTLIARTDSGLEATAKIKIYSEEEAEENEDAYNSCVWRIEKSATVKKNQYYQLKFHLSNKYSLDNEEPILLTTDDSVVEIGSAGVIHAVHSGKASVVCISNNEVSVCKITVPAKPGEVGTTVVKNGVKYKVTVNTSKSKKVACIGPEKKSIKRASIPATITIGGKKYKVTKINDSAFKNCKSLTSVSIGKYVEIIGGSAFLNCKKLTKITINASQPKIFKSSFKGVAAKASYHVPETAKKYYEIVLKGKKIVTHK